MVELLNTLRQRVDALGIFAHAFLQSLPGLGLRFQSALDVGNDLCRRSGSLGVSQLLVELFLGYAGVIARYLQRFHYWVRLTGVGHKVNVDKFVTCCHISCILCWFLMMVICQICRDAAV